MIQYNRIRLGFSFLFIFISSCWSVPCLNGVVKSDGDGCSLCYSGWAGPSCSLPCTCEKGLCSEGIQGNGKCLLCWPQFYGPSCDSVCLCKFGTCDNRPNGTGSCTSCLGNFSGVNCDQCLPNHAGPGCTKQCSCLKGICNAGREGDGRCAGDCDRGFSGYNCDCPEFCARGYYCTADTGGCILMTPSPTPSVTPTPTTTPSIGPSNVSLSSPTPVPSPRPTNASTSMVTPAPPKVSKDPKTMVTAITVMVASESSCFTDPPQFQMDLSKVLEISEQEVVVTPDVSNSAATITVASNDTDYVDTALQRLIHKAQWGDIVLSKLWITSIRITYWTPQPTEATTLPPPTFFIPPPKSKASSPIEDWHVIIITVGCIIFIVVIAVGITRLRKKFIRHEERVREEFIKKNRKKDPIELPGVDALDDPPPEVPTQGGVDGTDNFSDADPSEFTPARGAADIPPDNTNAVIIEPPPPPPSATGEEMSSGSKKIDPVGCGMSGNSDVPRMRPVQAEETEDPSP